MKLKSLLIACCILCTANLVLGQSTSNHVISKTDPEPSAQQPAAANVSEDLKKGFAEVNDWVTKAADMVPDEKYNYRPVDTVRTFGQIIAHITDSYNFFCSRGAGKKVEWSDATEKGTTDKATLVPKLKQAVEGCNAAYANGTAFSPLMGNVAHTSLHYGNIITYLRMMGMKPPSS
jgi:uncharacterized damage-inducible protein DinB